MLDIAVSTRRSPNPTAARQDDVVDHSTSSGSCSPNAVPCADAGQGHSGAGVKRTANTTTDAADYPALNPAIVHQASATATIPTTNTIHHGVSAPSFGSSIPPTLPNAAAAPFRGYSSVLTGLSSAPAITPQQSVTMFTVSSSIGSTSGASNGRRPIAYSNNGRVTRESSSVSLWYPSHGVAGSGVAEDSDRPLQLPLPSQHQQHQRSQFVDNAAAPSASSYAAGASSPPVTPLPIEMLTFGAAPMGHSNGQLAFSSSPLTPPVGGDAPACFASRSVPAAPPVRGCRENEHQQQLARWQSALQGVTSSPVLLESSWVAYDVYLTLSAPLLCDRALQDRVAQLCCPRAVSADGQKELVCLDNVVSFLLHGGSVTPPIAGPVTVAAAATGAGGIPAWFASGHSSATSFSHRSNSLASSSLSSEAQRMSFPLFCLTGAKLCTLSQPNLAIRSVHTPSTPVSMALAMAPGVLSSSSHSGTHGRANTASSFAGVTPRLQVLLLFAEQLLNAFPGFPEELLYTTCPSGCVVDAPPSEALPFWNSWQATPAAVRRSTPYNALWSVVTLPRLVVMLERWGISPAVAMRKFRALMAAPPSPPPPLQQTDLSQPRFSGPQPTPPQPLVTVPRQLELPMAESTSYLSIHTPQMAEQAAKAMTGGGTGSTVTATEAPPSSRTHAPAPATATISALKDWDYSSLQAAVGSSAELHSTPVAAAYRTVPRRSSPAAAAPTNAIPNVIAAALAGGQHASSTPPLSDDLPRSDEGGGAGAGGHPYNASFAADPTALLDGSGRTLYGRVHKYDVPSPPRPSSGATATPSCFRTFHGTGGVVPALASSDSSLEVWSYRPGGQSAYAPSPPRQDQPPAMPQRLPASLPSRSGRRQPHPSAPPYVLSRPATSPTSRRVVPSSATAARRAILSKLEKTAMVHPYDVEDVPPLASDSERKQKRHRGSSHRHRSEQKKSNSAALASAEEAEAVSSQRNTAKDDEVAATKPHANGSAAAASHKSSNGHALLPTPPPPLANGSSTHAKRRTEQVAAYMQALLSNANRTASISSNGGFSSSDAMHKSGSAVGLADLPQVPPQPSSNGSDPHAGSDRSNASANKNAINSGAAEAEVAVRQRVRAATQHVPVPPAFTPPPNSSPHASIVRSHDSSVVSHSSLIWGATESNTTSAEGLLRKPSSSSNPPELIHTSYPSATTTAERTQSDAPMVLSRGGADLIASASSSQSNMFALLPTEAPIASPPPPPFTPDAAAAAAMIVRNGKTSPVFTLHPQQAHSTLPGGEREPQRREGVYGEAQLRVPFVPPAAPLHPLQASGSALSHHSLSLPTVNGLTANGTTFPANSMEYVLSSTPLSFSSRPASYTSPTPEKTALWSSTAADYAAAAAGASHQAAAPPPREQMLVPQPPLPASPQPLPHPLNGGDAILVANAPASEPVAVTRESQQHPRTEDEGGSVPLHPPVSSASQVFSTSGLSFNTAAGQSPKTPQDISVSTATAPTEAPEEKQEEATSSPAYKRAASSALRCVPPAERHPAGSTGSTARTPEDEPATTTTTLGASVWAAAGPALEAAATTAASASPPLTPDSEEPGLVVHTGIARVSFAEEAADPRGASGVVVDSPASEAAIEEQQSEPPSEEPLHGDIAIQLQELIARVLQAVGRGYVARRQLCTVRSLLQRLQRAATATAATPAESPPAAVSEAHAATPPALATPHHRRRRVSLPPEGDEARAMAVAGGVAAVAVAAPEGVAAVAISATANAVAAPLVAHPPPLTGFTAPATPAGLHTPVMRGSLLIPSASLSSKVIPPAPGMESAETTEPGGTRNTSVRGPPSARERGLAHSSSQSSGLSSQHPSPGSPTQRLFTIYGGPSSSGMENSSSSFIPAQPAQSGTQVMYTTSYNESGILETKPLRIVKAVEQSLDASRFSSIVTPWSKERHSKGMTSTHTLPPPREEHTDEDDDDDEDANEAKATQLEPKRDLDSGSGSSSGSGRHRFQRGNHGILTTAVPRAKVKSTPLSATPPSLMKPIVIPLRDPLSDGTNPSILKESTEDWMNLLHSKLGGGASGTLAFFGQSTNGPSISSTLSPPASFIEAQQLQQRSADRRTSLSFDSGWALTGAIAMLRVQRIGRGYLARHHLAQLYRDRQEEDNLDALLMNVLQPSQPPSPTPLTPPTPPLPKDAEKDAEDEAAAAAAAAANTSGGVLSPTVSSGTPSLQSPTISVTPESTPSVAGPLADGSGAAAVHNNSDYSQRAQQQQEQQQQSPPMSFQAPSLPPPFHADGIDGGAPSAQSSGSAYAADRDSTDISLPPSSGATPTTNTGDGGGGLTALQRGGRTSPLVTPDGSRYLIPQALTSPKSRSGGLRPFPLLRLNSSHSLSLSREVTNTQATEVAKTAAASSATHDTFEEGEKLESPSLPPSASKRNDAVSPPSLRVSFSRDSIIPVQLPGSGMNSTPAVTSSTAAASGPPTVTAAAAAAAILGVSTTELTGSYSQFHVNDTASGAHSLGHSAPASPTVLTAPAFMSVLAKAAAAEEERAAAASAAAAAAAASAASGTTVEEEEEQKAEPTGAARRTPSPHWRAVSAAAGATLSPLDGSIFAQSGRSGRSMSSANSLPFDFSTTAHAVSAMLQSEELFSTRTPENMTPAQWPLDGVEVVETSSHSGDSDSGDDEDTRGSSDSDDDDSSSDDDAREADAFKKDISHIEEGGAEPACFGAAAHVLRGEAAPLKKDAALAMLQRIGRGYLCRRYQHFMFMVSVSWAEVALIQRVTVGFLARRKLALDFYVTKLAKQELAFWERRNSAAVRMQSVVRGFIARQRVKRLQRKLFTRLELRTALEQPDPDE